jgi:hypothetical protein
MALSRDDDWAWAEAAAPQQDLVFSVHAVQSDPAIRIDKSAKST